MLFAGAEVNWIDETKIILNPLVGLLLLLVGEQGLAHPVKVFAQSVAHVWHHWIFQA